jgi:hypothetical protein
LPGIEAPSLWWTTLKIRPPSPLVLIVRDKFSNL